MRCAEYQQLDESLGPPKRIGYCPTIPQGKSGLQLAIQLSNEYRRWRHRAAVQRCEPAKVGSILRGGVADPQLQNHVLSRREWATPASEEPPEP
jgi:hypothetical protein